MTDALLVIDLQRDFVEDESSPVFVAGARAIVPRIARVADAFRAAGRPVVHVVTRHAADGSTASRFDRARGRVYCVEGTPGAEIVEALAPRAGEPVVAKTRYSGFHRTDLEAVLRRLGVDALAFAGVTATTCVGATARDALYRDFRLTLLVDCVHAAVPAMLEAEVLFWRRSLGDVMTSAAYLEGMPAA